MIVGVGGWVIFGVAMAGIVLYVIFSALVFRWVHREWRKFKDTEG